MDFIEEALLDLSCMDDKKCFNFWSGVIACICVVLFYSSVAALLGRTLYFSWPWFKEDGKIGFDLFYFHSAQPIIVGTICLIGLLILMAGYFRVVTQSRPSFPENAKQLASGVIENFFFVAFLLLTSLVALSAAQATLGNQILSLIVTGFFVYMSVVYLYHGFILKMSFDENAVYYWSPFSGFNEIPWSEIKMTKYSILFGGVTIVTKRKGKVLCLEFMKGFKELSELIDRLKTPAIRVNEDGAHGLYFGNPVFFVEWNKVIRIEVKRLLNDPDGDDLWWIFHTSDSDEPLRVAKTVRNSEALWDAIETQFSGVDVDKIRKAKESQQDGLFVIWQQDL